jgi:hypothetical protein
MTRREMRLRAFVAMRFDAQTMAGVIDPAIADLRRKAMQESA